MQLAVLADIHGDLTALEAVLADMAYYDIAGIIAAGDLVAGGPQPRETLDRLQALGCRMIRGNTEDYLMTLEDGRAPAGMRTAAQWALTRWSHSRLPREMLGFIAALPEADVVTLPGAAPIRVVHGAPGKPNRFLFPDRDPERMARFRRNRALRADEPPPHLASDVAMVPEPALVCGHSHVSWQQTEGGTLVVNPGAVSGALEGDALAHYGLLRWQAGAWRAELRCVPYDLDRSRTAFEQSGLLAEGGPLARAFLLSAETGENVGYFLVLHAYRLAAQAGCENCEFVPDDVWDEADRSFDWPHWEALRRTRSRPGLP